MASEAPPQTDEKFTPRHLLRVETDPGRCSSCATKPGSWSPGGDGGRRLAAEEPIDRSPSHEARPIGTLATRLLIGLMTLAVLLSGCGAPVLHQRMSQNVFPEFPWPPPRASATEVLPNSLINVVADSTTLGDIDQWITSTLHSTGYFENSYLAVPGGFALVTRLEQIESTGESKNGPERWSLDPAPVPFSITNYLESLFFGTPGYYRVIVFIITPYPFSQSDERVTPDLTHSWLADGFNRLPREVAHLNYTDSFATTVLIYEFARATENDQPSFTYPGDLLSRVHLKRSGIWSALQS